MSYGVLYALFFSIAVLLAGVFLPDHREALFAVGFSSVVGMLLATLATQAGIRAADRARK
jgi:hypothetical protein